MIGKVVEVFIPNLNDIMNSKTIGFKVLVKDKLYEIIQEQTTKNAVIFKNDLVLVTLNNDEITDLQLYEEDYE